MLHLGFGEAGLPVPETVRDVLARASRANGYGPVAGSAAAREAAAGYFGRRRLLTSPDQIVFAPGSKPLLYALVAALPGDVVLPRPSWVSYAAHAALAGRRVFRVPIPREAGGLPDPEALVDVVAAARAGGADPRILVLTSPDNPTGTVAPAGLLEQVADVAGREGLSIVSDEIYRDLAYAPAAFRSPAELLPERTYVTSGLSKSMALGGWRIGFARFPAGAAGTATRDQVLGIASEVWSSLAAPMQAVAEHVLAEPPDVVEHVAGARELHSAATSAVHEALVGRGVDCRPPTGGFYLYPDLAPLAPKVESGAALAELMLERFGIAVLAGDAFGDEPTALRFRLATSLLHTGADDVRRAIDRLEVAIDGLIDP